VAIFFIVQDITMEQNGLPELDDNIFDMFWGKIDFEGAPPKQYWVSGLLFDLNHLDLPSRSIPASFGWF